MFSSFFVCKNSKIPSSFFFFFFSIELQFTFFFGYFLPFPLVSFHPNRIFKIWHFSSKLLQRRVYQWWKRPTEKLWKWSSKSEKMDKSREEEERSEKRDLHWAKAQEAFQEHRLGLQRTSRRVLSRLVAGVSRTLRSAGTPPPAVPANP